MKKARQTLFVFLLVSAITGAGIYWLFRANASLAAPLSWLSPTLYPPANSNNTYQSSNIGIEFSENISASTFTSNTMTVHSALLGKMELFQPLSSQAGFISGLPTASFGFGDTIGVTVKNDFQNLSGQSAPRPVVWQFRTANTPGGGYFGSQQTASPGIIWAIEAGDLNGDLLNDLFIGTDEGDQVWLNSGGVLADSSQRLGVFQKTVDAALGDLDNDGDLDALSIKSVRNLAAAAQVWLNDGQGILTAGTILTPTTTYRSAALGDFNGDGFLDAVIAGVNGGDVWLNQGAGRFNQTGNLNGLSDAFSIAAGDIDLDGDLDVFIATGTNLPDRVYLNDGTGVFSDSGQNLGAESGYAALLGDLDGDGDLDAFVGNGGTAPGGVLWSNSGPGLYSAALQSFGTEMITAAAMADVDGDFDLDIISGAKGGVVWANNGVMVFENANIALSNANADALIAADITGIGHMDIILENGSLFVFRNYEPQSCEADCRDTACSVSCVLVCTAVPGDARLPLQAAALDLNIFYGVRDQVLGQTAAGQRLSGLYYQHNPEIMRQLLISPTLMTEAASVLNTWQPNLQAMLNGQGSGAVITTGQVQAIQNFLTRLERVSSPKLKAAIAAERAALPAMETFVGKNMDQARSELVGFGLFMPVVQR